MLARFIKWLIDYKECDRMHCECIDRVDAKICDADLYNSRQYEGLSRLFDQNNKNIEANLKDMSKRIEVFFERQKCFLCGKIAKDCEASKTHPYEKD